MKILIAWSYSLLSWLILSLLALILFLLFVLESPSSVLNFARTPLADYNITYGEMRGSLLTGFSLTNVNYNNQVKAKELSLEVDFNQLENRVLYIDSLVLKDAEIEREFLRSLLDVNKTDESNSSEGNFTLPFDTLIVRSAELSLKNTGYDTYFLNQVHLDVKNLKTDMKEQYQAQIDFSLDSNMTQANLNIDYLNGQYKIAGNLEGEQLFINKFVEEQNLSLTKNPQMKFDLTGDMQSLKYDVSINNLLIKQNTLWLKSEKIVSKGKYNIEKKYLDAKLFTVLDSSLAKVNLDVKSKVSIEDINESLLFDVTLNVDPKKQLEKEKFLEQFLAENNLSINQVPEVKFLVKGNMKKSIFSLQIEGLRAKQNDIILNVNNFNLKGEVQPLKGNTKVDLSTDIFSSIVDIQGDMKSNFNFKDVNNSLKFNTKLYLEAHASYVNKLLKENNVSLDRDTLLTLEADGTMKKSKFNLELKKMKGKQNAIHFSLPNLRLKGDIAPLDGHVETQLSTFFNSTVADGDLTLHSAFNFNDVNNSLNLDAKTNIKVHSAYLNPLLKESGVRFKGEIPLAFKAKGDMHRLLLQLNGSSRVVAQKIDSSIRIKTSPIVLNIQNHQVEGKFTLHSKANNMLFKLQSDFSGDYLNPEEMNTRTKMDVNKFNAFGVNLNSLTPLHFLLNKQKKGAKVDLNSKKIQMHIKSPDLEHIVFTLKSRKIYPEKFTKVPKALKKKFILLNLKGEATFSKQYFSLKGFIESNKKFKINLDAKNSKKGLKASLKGKHLKLLIHGDVNKKDIQASVDVDSLKMLQEEFLKLYTFSLVPVDGALHVQAKMKGEEIWAKVNSPKIKLEGFRVEELLLDAHYKKELLTLNKFEFKTKGFTNKKLNRAFYLNKKGLVHLGKKRDILIDMHPKILFKATGTQENLKALAQIESLPLGHPDYGDMILSCDIDYVQKGRKKRIVGGVFLDQLKLHYESSFLDPSSDPDVVVITKKDKKRGKTAGSFEEDVFIDLSIYAGDGRYKTRDIDLTFDINVKASKKFGESLRMLGKVEDINGRVEQAPKLFTVVDSNIVFKGSKEINPLLDLEVKHELPDVLITIKIHGTPKRPKLDFSSEPPLPKKDILSYLLFGVSTANLAEGEGNLGREAELFIMNQAARDFAYELELDRVFIKDDGTGEGYAIQVGKKINEKSMAIIETSKEGNSFILEYDVNKNIKVEVGHHQKTIPSQSIDIYFRKRFK